MSRYTKTVVNKTQTPINVHIYIRLGSDNIDLNYTTIEEELAPDKSSSIPLPEDANPGNIPFLNGIHILTDDYKYSVTVVERRSDANDNLLNKNQILTITNSAGKINIEGKN